LRKEPEMTVLEMVPRKGGKIRLDRPDNPLPDGGEMVLFTKVGKFHFTNEECLALATGLSGDVIREMVKACIQEAMHTHSVTASDAEVAIRP
jgi:hypothetical protein